jgi:hypothetical protein
MLSAGIEPATFVRQPSLSMSGEDELFGGRGFQESSETIRKILSTQTHFRMDAELSAEGTPLSNEALLIPRSKSSVDKVGILAIPLQRSGGSTAIDA